MSRYDGLIIPRSYSDYINKTDAATLLQALQLSGVMDSVPTPGSNHPVKSGGIEYLIWENPNPSLPFAAQTVNYDREIPAGYTKIMVEAKNLYTSDFITYTECKIGVENYLVLHIITSRGNMICANRVIRNITNTECVVDLCRYVSTAGAYEETPTRMVPLRIWAIA